MPGPIPKRSDQRRRRNQSEVTLLKAQGAEEVARPEPDPSWHKGARAWYDSLEASGQAKFYEPSDWATAHIWATFLSSQLTSEKPNSMIISAWSSAATELLTTEGARRRARLELERGEAEEAQVIDYRARAGRTARG